MGVDSSRGGAGIALAFRPCVLRLHHSRGWPAGDLVGCYDPTAQVLLYSYTRTDGCQLHNLKVESNVFAYIYM
jgi:hypothetical protein